MHCCGIGHETLLSTLKLAPGGTTIGSIDHPEALAADGSNTAQTRTKPTLRAAVRRTSNPFAITGTARDAGRDDYIPRYPAAQEHDITARERQVPIAR